MGTNKDIMEFLFEEGSFGIPNAVGFIIDAILLVGTYLFVRFMTQQM